MPLFLQTNYLYTSYRELLHCSLLKRASAGTIEKYGALALSYARDTRLETRSLFLFYSVKSKIYCFVFFVFLKDCEAKVIEGAGA